MDRRDTVAVLGAGPSGLAAAWALSRGGRGVTVYEETPRVGGRLRTEVVSEAAADVAVQLVSSGYDRFLELVRELGSADRLVESPGRDALWRGGRPHPLRYGSVTSMAASGALPASLKLRLGLRYVPYLERHREVLDLNDPARAAAAGLDRESIAAWGTREVGREFVELLVYPLLASYYGAAPEETSAAFFHALARAGQRVAVLGSVGGIGALAESLAAALRNRGVRFVTEWPVESLRPEADGVVVAGPRGEVAHAAVVVAVPPVVAAGLVPGAPWLAELRTRPTATLVLATEGATRPGWFGLSIPRSELPESPLAAVCVQEEKGTSLEAPGRGALVLIPRPDVSESWAESNPKAVLEAALPTLERVLPDAAARVVEARLIRLRSGAFVPHPGWFERLRTLDPVVAPRLVLAGDYLVAPTVEGAVRSGEAAAERVSRAGW